MQISAFRKLNKERLQLLWSVIAGAWEFNEYYFIKHSNL